MVINRDMNGFLTVEFTEHPVVDLKKEKGYLFDVKTEALPDFATDFIEDGSFSHRQYCMCLIEMALDFSLSQLPGFLDYQCKQLNAPCRWLNNFLSLIQVNSDHDLIKDDHDKIGFLSALIREKRNHLSGFIKKRKQGRVFEPGVKYQKNEKYDIDKVKEDLQDEIGFINKELFLIRWRTNYLQETGTKEKDPFINAIDLELGYLNVIKNMKGENQNQKMYTFKGSPTQLASIYAQMVELRDKKGDLIFDGATTNLVRIICGGYCNANGQLFSESSIRRLLTDFKSGKKSKARNQIDFSIGLEDE